MEGKARAHSETATRFESYLEELGDLVGNEDRRAELEEEFRRALGTLIRHRYESAHNLLKGSPGLELVHETLARILHDGLEEEPGSLMRLVSRVGHRLFRSRAGSGMSLEDSFASIESISHTNPASGDMELRSLDLSLQQEERTFLRILLDHDQHKKRSGRLHFAKLADELEITTKDLRLRLRTLLSKLGRDREYQEFWFKRLAEASTELYRIRTEEELGDLLGSRLQTQKRLRLVLSRLRSYGAASSLHPDLQDKQSLSQALRLLRLHQRKPVIPCEILSKAARLLGADTLALDLVEAERLRAMGEAEQAFTLLEPWRSGSLPPRRSLLLRLARARCLEKMGQTGEASDLLEASLSASRNDPLFQYNRFVLARLSGKQERARAAHRELGQARAEGSLSPLLLRGIRLALDQEPK